MWDETDDTCHLNSTARMALRAAAIVLSYGIPEYSNSFDLAFDNIAWKKIARRGDETFLRLPMTAKLFVSGPCRARGCSGDDNHPRLQREIC